MESSGLCKWSVVMCRARLSSKAQAWAWLDQAQAWQNGELGPGIGPRASLGLAQAQAGAW